MLVCKGVETSHTTSGMIIRTLRGDADQRGTRDMRSCTSTAALASPSVYHRHHVAAVIITIAGFITRNCQPSYIISQHISAADVMCINRAS